MTFGAVNFDYRAGRLHRKVDGLVGIMRIEGTVYEEIYKDADCPGCSHRREVKEKVSILWMMHGNEDKSVDVIMCDKCAVRLARGILNDAEAGLVLDSSNAEMSFRSQ